MLDRTVNSPMGCVSQDVDACSMARSYRYTIGMHPAQGAPKKTTFQLVVEGDQQDCGSWMQAIWKALDINDYEIQTRSKIGPITRPKQTFEGLSMTANL